MVPNWDNNGMERGCALLDEVNAECMDPCSCKQETFMSGFSYFANQVEKETVSIVEYANLNNFPIDPQNQMT